VIRVPNISEYDGALLVLLLLVVGPGRRSIKQQCINKLSDKMVSDNMML
jgi:hypothetical protein